MFSFPKHLLIVDVETTGTDPETSSIIQLGACILNKKGYLEPYTFNEYIIPYTPEWIEGAEKVHQITYSQIQKKGKPLKEVLERFEQWASDYLLGELKKKFWLAQWSAGFDTSMLKSAYKAIDKNYPFHYRAFDVASIVRFELAKQGKLYQECGEDKCALTLGIKVDKNKLHDALYDAQLSGKMLENLIQGDNDGHK